MGIKQGVIVSIPLPIYLFASILFSPFICKSYPVPPKGEFLVKKIGSSVVKLIY
jgi:hypothetical protein